MRVHLIRDSSAEEFAKQLLLLGNGQWSSNSNNTMSFLFNFFSLVELIDELKNEVFQGLK